MKRYIVALTTVALVSAAGTASAGTCDTIIMEQENFGPNTPNFTQVLNFEQYHGNPADLCSIHVELFLAIDGGFLVVDNDGVDPASFMASLGASGNLTSMDVPLLNIAFQPVVAPVNVATVQGFDLAGDNGDGPGPAFVDPNPPDGATMLGQPGNNMDDGFINPALFGAYAGPGTFNVDAVVTQIVNFGGVGGVEGAFGSVTANGYVKITMLVPEPATMSLLGIGLLPLLRRRK